MLDKVPLNDFFLSVFRERIAGSIGVRRGASQRDGLMPGYRGMIQLALALNNAPLPAGVEVHGATRADIDTRTTTRDQQGAG